MLSKKFKEHCKKCKHHEMDHFGIEKHHYCCYGITERDREGDNEVFIWVTEGTKYRPYMSEEYCPLYLEYIVDAK